jgi:hypothetical protein
VKAEIDYGSRDGNYVSAEMNYGSAEIDYGSRDGNYVMRDGGFGQYYRYYDIVYVVGEF